jgi:hypothetical protein
MEPVRIKYYGLIRMTKATYLIATLVTGAVAASLFLIAFLMGVMPTFRWPWEAAARPDITGLSGWIYNHVYDIIIICLLAEVVDIVITLRSFARKEAERSSSTNRT